MRRIAAKPSLRLVGERQGLLSEHSVARPSAILSHAFVGESGCVIASRAGWRETRFPGPGSAQTEGRPLPGAPWRRCPSRSGHARARRAARCPSAMVWCIERSSCLFLIDDQDHDASSAASGPVGAHRRSAKRSRTGARDSESAGRANRQAGRASGHCRPYRNSPFAEAALESGEAPGNRGRAVRAATGSMSVTRQVIAEDAGPVQFDEQRMTSRAERAAAFAVVGDGRFKPLERLIPFPESPDCRRRAALALALGFLLMGTTACSPPESLKRGIGIPAYSL